MKNRQNEKHFPHRPRRGGYEGCGIPLKAAVMILSAALLLAVSPPSQLQSETSIPGHTAVAMAASILSGPDVSSPSTVESQPEGTGSPSPSVTPGPVNPILDYTLDVASESVLVIETGRGMQLYIKNPDVIAPIPIASKLMTALLAVESIPESTMVTISTVAARSQDANVLSLRAGEKYSLEYLLHGLILKDNNAAALALAEQISGTVDEFVVLMNARASSYQMTNTVFTNPTGQPDDAQFTTIADVSRLFRFAMAFTRFERIFKTRDSVFILSTNLTKHLISNAESMWTIPEGTTGVFQSATKSRSSYAVTAKSGQINIMVIGTSSSGNKNVNDVSLITSSIFRDYEYSRFINKGQIFPKTMTVDGKTFSMNFITDINYVHPYGVDFIHSTQYEPLPDIMLPIRTTKPVAKVTFLLYDGTKISADLYPTEDIWGDSGLYRRLLDLYTANKDVGNLILIASVMLVLMVCVRIYTLIARLVSGKRRGSVRRDGT